ncbi:hypothetical protein JW813_16785 [Clostridium botulinum]|uniref:hypothetical protein n=1 Tax=Clostridium botulinum TaxID=1491 RepID=UPI000A793CFB|nr:hypothetical protein [Clostridium botulinum]MBY6805167.1 hypothetical protein [Clostridium botulinum]MBY6815184.1 hypothetical protein [Clostridium botulinum]MBY6821788.1 hypothetical protein [Clostridium botulinum]UZP03342.1 hypothetical protein JW813_16785 [Clostridium botulinum]UZP06700.1 hypothetical protein JYA71_17055 [Clostridium botulinum]
MNKEKINYDEFIVTCNKQPCEAALTNYYNILIDSLINKYGNEPVRIALEELITEKQ